MFLKCIEMSGFKSFPEKTQMHMNGSIIGVVGPNGSGKSNVSDAVRWVLGEQSAKSLRGGMMQDVIFAGTQARKPRSYCEVTLLFDNGDRKMGPEYSEIEVTRKLYRSGESEYFINGTKCRLKDILTLFRDTGIGREGYSIIGQGRIDEILSEKSLDRRRVFEEASGIMKYRVRKEEAERKLEKTHENMQRVTDILAEQAFMLEPLKKQAEDAAVYLELGKRLRALDVNLFLQQCDRLRERIAKLEQQRRELDEERANKEQLAEELAQKLVSMQEQARHSEENTGALAEKLSIAMAELERVEGELKLCNERIQNNEKDTQRIRGEMEEAETRAANAAKNELTNKQRLAGIEEELAKNRKAVSDAQTELEQLNKDIEDKASVIESAQNARVESIERMADVRSAVSALEEKRGSLTQRIEEMKQRVAEAEAEKNKLGQTLAALEEDQNRIRQRSDDARSAFNEAVQRDRQGMQEAAEAQQALEAARREYATCVSSARMLTDLKDSYEGYMDSVKNLMLSARSQPDIAQRILGTVADALHVPAKYEAAVEACLGGALQNVIVGDEYDAKHIISHLRKNNMGRVTFLPVNSLKVRTLSGDERAALKESGVLGVASELVSCADGVRSAIDFLLGRTVIVDESDTAIQVMRRCNQSLRVVTVAGDVFNPGGSITGGSLKRERSGLVSRDRREEELKARAEQLKSNVAALDRVLADKVKDRETQQKRIEELRAGLHDGEVEAAAVREKREALGAAQTDAALRAFTLKKELDALEETMTRTLQELEGFAALQQDMQQASESHGDDVKRLEEEYSRRNVRIEELKRIIHDAEVSIAVLFRENAAVVSDNMRLGLEKQEAERQRMAKAKTLELQKESADNLCDFKAQLQETYNSRTALLDSHKRQQGALAESRLALLDKLSALEAELEQTRRAVSELKEKSLRTGFNAEKAQTDIETAQNRLWDSYQLTYANALAEREDIELSGAAAEAEEIRVRLREMGNVNPAAIDDYAALKERMTSLATQKDDMLSAEEDLRKLIASLLSEMKRVFRQSFEQINMYFGKTFKELFDGGRAELILEEGDIMECGIEIVAEPPGKKLQKLSLLSGGEKALTAISLLFALLKINPSPVCILDEIDAALDDANVAKFSEYLEKYAARDVQFIVITHRKPTMSVCDSLYGLAMEEKGVSKLLSVRLDREGA